MKKLQIFRNVTFTFLLGLTVWFSACSDWVDDYEMNDHEPNYLKSSIYDYLKEDGHYTYFTRIIDMSSEEGINYKEVLSKTGSKTLFVANDEAFEEFFANNNLGIKKFEDFSRAQCRSILFGGMLDNTYLLAMLTYAPGNPPQMGKVMRREVPIPLDTVLLRNGTNIPNSPVWDPFRTDGLYLVNDISNYTLVHFLPAQMQMNNNISDNDFYTMTHIHREATDAYLFDIKIVESDIICKNGYIHRLEKLLLPRETMAEYIDRDPNITKFKGFLDRYAFPVIHEDLTREYKKSHPDFTGDIYVKWYFNKQEPRPSFNVAPLAWPTNISSYLSYSPGKQAYRQGGVSTLQEDMGVMFVPTNEALEDYFNNTQSGSILKERYPDWDAVPDNVLEALINFHMRGSFLEATPSRFATLADQMGTSMGVQPSDVLYSYLCSNGVVYVTDKVYAPTEYVAVTAPVLMGAQTTIFNWIVRQLRFDLYLLSMEEGNRFTLFVPIDNNFQNYVDPRTVEYGADGSIIASETLRFYIDPVNNNLKADRYNQAGAFVGTHDLAYAPDPSNQARDRLYYLCMDIIDNHIVLEDISPDKTYYRTKGGGSLIVSNQATGQATDMRIVGGANIDRGETIAVTREYNMVNGNTYLVDQVLQTPLKSVAYEFLQKSEFSEFAQLCRDVRQITSLIDGKKVAGAVFGGNGVGIDENIRFFSTFNYTVYVPTNAAIQQAITDGLIMRWSDILALESSDYTRYLREAQNLYDFLSYHFQDNSVYVSDKFAVDDISGERQKEYETANLERDATGNLTGKFTKLKIVADGVSLKVKGIGNTTGYVNVVTTNPACYNLMTRDYQFITGTPPTNLSTSSYAVVHQIDGVLRYK
ncbi:hypothetical protein FACS1894162_3140 [Bacteroidia bacterium]|nr:hypothetical protein FACS1894162_3140 [Bacteroidia bacterium]